MATKLKAGDVPNDVFLRHWNNKDLDNEQVMELICRDVSAATGVTDYEFSGLEVLRAKSRSVTLKAMCTVDRDLKTGTVKAKVKRDWAVAAKELEKLGGIDSDAGIAYANARNAAARKKLVDGATTTTRSRRRSAASSQAATAQQGEGVTISIKARDLNGRDHDLTRTEPDLDQAKIALVVAIWNLGSGRNPPKMVIRDLATGQNVPTGHEFIEDGGRYALMNMPAAG